MLQLETVTQHLIKFDMRQLKHKIKTCYIIHKKPFQTVTIREVRRNIIEDHKATATVLDLCASFKTRK